MQSWFQNVLILKPQHETECRQYPRWPTSCLGLDLAHNEEWTRRNHPFTDAPPADGDVDKQRPVWRCVACEKFQPLYGSSNPVMYKFQRLPPSVSLTYNTSASLTHHEKYGNERPESESFISPLTKRMLCEPKQRLQEHCKGKAPLNELWCTCKQKKISSDDQEKDFGLRCKATLLCLGDTDMRTVWKRLSNSIANGSLGDCNSCFKRSENKIYLFFYEHRRQLIEQWLENVFHRTVELKVI